MTERHLEETALKATLRDRATSGGKKDAYYLTEHEYRMGKRLGLIREIERKPQGKDVFSVIVEFEGNRYICSISNERR
jgi:hypothetical protein